MAFLGGHLHRRRPGARHPHRRVRLLQRLGNHVARRHLDVLALEAGERLLDHAADRDLEGLLPHGRACRRGRCRSRRARPTDDPSPVPNSTRPLDRWSSVATRSAMRAGWLIGGRQVHDAEAEPDVLGALARRGQEHLGRGGVAVLLEEVVLGEPHRGEAGLVGGLHLVETVLEQLVLVVLRPRPRQRELVEQRDLHCVTSDVSRSERVGCVG